MFRDNSILRHNLDFLAAAQDAAMALIRGQNKLGGWVHKIYFYNLKSKSVSFDDNQTQSAIRFLMALDQVIDNDSLSIAIESALSMMLTSQLDTGAWPHIYPKQGNYHDYATFNDQGINDCITVMMDAYRYYDKKEFMKSLHLAGKFLMISQLPPPQPGWAQQYNEFLQPAWARSFEPPSVCPLVTVNNINTLIDLVLFTHQKWYLEAIPDAIRWLQDIRLPNGKWARFVELYTNKPLYYDRGRIRVKSTKELSIERRTGYGYEIDIAQRLGETIQRFQDVKQLGAREYLAQKNKKLSKTMAISKLAEMATPVQEIISSQDAQGRWVTKNDRYKNQVPGVLWEGEYITKDRISSALFIKNVDTLCKFLEIYKSIEE